MGVSLGLFVIYWAFLIGGEDLADREFVSPFMAMWSADFLIGLVGLLLLWSVTNEVTLTPRAIWDGMTGQVTQGAREGAGGEARDKRIEAAS
jgi:lipopolysaccharide export system permease protein